MKISNLLKAILAWASPRFKCKICGALHGGGMPDPDICRECWNKGHR
jgi:hypothetical protein